MSKRRILKNLFYFLVVFIFCLVILEWGLRISFRTREIRLWSKEKRYRSSVYEDSPWAKRYFDIFDEKVKEVYHPFCGWRKEEFRSKLINISSDGIRKTWNPEYREDLKKVFVFGGSTVWGTGVRDEFTIPSLLSKNLNRFQDSYFVINYGEAAYVSTQEVILLITQLREGNIPDYVIFYDGVNDVEAAFLNGKAGLIYHYIRLRMKLDMEPKIFNQMTKEAFLENSKLYSSIVSIINKYIKKRKSPIYTHTEFKKLAPQIIQEYIKNITFVEKLSKIYGFKYIFIWQPSLFTIKSKTSEEEKILAVGDRDLEKLFINTYKLADKLDIANFYNLSHIFDNKTETIFIDDCHIGEKQCKIVADNIFELMRNEFKR